MEKNQAATMSYREADRIKKKRLTQLVNERKYQYGQSGGAALKGAISDTVKAKMTRMKKIVDPLVWANYLLPKGNWFGGDIGRGVFTSLGRALGKSDEDIAYYGGYRKRNNIPAIEREQTTDKETTKSMPVLTKMYDFLKKTEEDEVRRRELDNNKREEINNEDERRHKELLQAISSASIKKTASPVKQEKKKSFFENLVDMFNDLVTKIKEIWTSISETIMPIINAVKSVFGGIWNVITKAASMFGVELLLGAAPLALLGLAAYAAQGSETGGNTEAQTKTMETILDKSGFKGQTSDVVPEEDMEGRPGIFGKRSAYDARKKRIQGSFELGTTYSEEDAKRIKTAYELEVPKQNIEEAKTTASPLPEGVKPSTAGAGRGVVNPEVVKPETKSTPVETKSSQGEKVSNLSKESADLKLKDKFQKPAEQIVNKQTINNIKNQTDTKTKLPSVRNPEMSFQRMIFDSTRVV